MHTRRMECARDDLHHILVRPVTPDIGNIAATVHQHGVPREQRPIIERLGMVAIHIGHEFGGPGLLRAGLALVGSKAQVARERRLNAGTVKYLTLYGGAIDNLLGDKFDGQAVALIGVQVVERTDDDAGAFQELLFGCADAIRVEAEIRPVGKLLIPAHDE